MVKRAKGAHILQMELLGGQDNLVKLQLSVLIVTAKENLTLRFIKDPC